MSHPSRDQLTSYTETAMAYLENEPPSIVIRLFVESFRIEARNSFNSMLALVAFNAAYVYLDMQLSGLHPDNYSFSFFLKDLIAGNQTLKS
jgi:hypothetical protein